LEVVVTEQGLPPGALVIGAPAGQPRVNGADPADSRESAGSATRRFAPDPAPDPPRTPRPGPAGESPREPRWPAGRIAEHGFYAAVLGISIAGAGTGAANHIGWPLPAAVAAAGVFEVGGVVLSAHADSRRIAGERALAARCLAVLIAAGACALNFAAHAIDPESGRFAESSRDLYTALFFSGLSAVGFATWRILRGAGHRDARRAAGEMIGTAPTYGVWQWLRHPRITAGARARALADPTLGLLGSLAAERDAERVAARRRAIGEVLGQAIRAKAGPLHGRIATLVYDTDRIATELMRRADYGLLTDLVGQELTADRLAPTGSGDSPEVGRVGSGRGESGGSGGSADGGSPRVIRHGADRGESPRPGRVIDGGFGDSTRGDSSADSADPADSGRVDLTDSQTRAVIRSYVTECWRAGREPGQREMLRQVHAAGGKGSQRRCVAIAKLIREELEGSAGVDDA
jgi:hypothetical protein